MADNLREELVRNGVRVCLRDQNIKLWMSPYVEENGEQNATVMEALAQEYALQLKFEKKECLQSLTSLQNNAISRMKELEQFRSGGIATLQIRYSGFGTCRSNSLPCTSKAEVPGGSKIPEKVEISLTAMGKDLTNAISKISGKPSDQIKLVCNGHIIKKDLILKEQGVKSSSRIMAIALSHQTDEVDESQIHERLFEKTRSAALTLSKERNQFAALELEDQTGSSLKLDQREKEALCLALALHERGRAALKRGDHSIALLLLLEADQEYGRCNSDLLKSVDNVALLQLDIVWCYLCMRSISHIPDADQRLSRCEFTLERSYGKHLERVQALKGTAGNEAALLMRLHLLQAIVAFHLNKIDMARTLLQKAEHELHGLKVNPDDIAKIVSLGYTTSEALLGLRACQGHLNAAVLRICEWQEERKRAREQTKKERAKERERAKLGKTADGSQFIEPDCVETLCGMGYHRNLAISALKHSNNNMTQAVYLMQEQPHLLGPETKCVRITAEEITQIAAMGFDVDMARLALRKHNGCFEDAVADLVNNKGIIFLDPEQQLPEEEFDDLCNPSTSSSELSMDGEESEDSTEPKEKKKRKQMEAASELQNDISEVENDHLCITLDEETKFLQEYKTLLDN